MALKRDLNGIVYSEKPVLELVFDCCEDGNSGDPQPRCLV
jgi:hypothetical protein